MDLLAQIDARALAAPQRVAHLSGGRQLSYGELSTSAQMGDSPGRGQSPSLDLRQKVHACLSG